MNTYYTKGVTPVRPGAYLCYESTNGVMPVFNTGDGMKAAYRLARYTGGFTGSYNEFVLLLENMQMLETAVNQILGV